MKFDREIIDARVEKIRANLTQLQEYAKVSLEEFLADSAKIAATERLLQISIQSMLDLGNHIIAVAGFEEPTEYREVFEILGKRRIFDKDFVKTLTEMVSLRNRLVHVYMEVDPAKLYEIITKELNDFEKFIAIIYKYIVGSESNL